MEGILVPQKEQSKPKNHWTFQNGQTIIKIYVKTLTQIRRNKKWQDQ